MGISAVQGGRLISQIECVGDMSMKSPEAYHLYIGPATDLYLQFLLDLTLAHLAVSIADFCIVEFAVILNH